MSSEGSSCSRRRARVVVWRRRDRLLRRLPPRPRRVDRRRAPRARPAHLGHHVARGRADGHVRLDCPRRRPRCGKYTRDLYARLEAETGLATGFKQVGSSRSRPTPTGSRSTERVSAFNRYCGVDVHEISPREVGELFPLARTDDMLAGFYVAEDGRANPVDVTMALAKGARHARRDASSRASPSPAFCTRRGAVTRRAHRARRHRGRVRRELRRHVGAPAGARPRREHPAAGRRALLPDHRQIAGLTAAPGARGPGRLRLLPRGGRRPDRRPVRAGVRAVAASTASPTTSRSASSSPTGSAWRRASRQAMRRVPVTSTTGVRTFFCGPESFTPDLAPLLGEAPELHELLRRRGHELDRHPDRRWDRPGARALDRRRPPRRRRDRVQHRPAAALPGEPRVPAHAHGRVAGHGVPAPLPAGQSMQTARGAKRRRCTTGWRPRARLPRRQRLGGADWFAGPPAGSATPDAADLGPAGLVRPRRRPSTAPLREA